VAEAQREEARGRLDVLTAARKAKVAEAEIHLREVREVTPLEIQGLEKQVALLTRQRDAEIAYLQKLEARSLELTSRMELETKERAVRVAEIELARVAATLDKARAARDVNLQAAQTELREARAALERTPKEVPLASLENACRLAEDRLLAAGVRAPVSGRVLKVFARPGEAAGPRPFLQMADTRQMMTRAEVYETDAARVRPGQAVTVTSPALPAPGLKGVVSRVGQTVGRNRVLDPDPTADVDRRVVEVMVRLEQAEAAARWINLEVRVAIAAESAGE
jgi:HlyD family secretion protein